MGLFTAPRRFARRVTVGLPARWHSERTAGETIKQLTLRLPRLPKPGDAWRWFITTVPAVAVALVLAILMLLVALLLSSHVRR